MRSASWRRLDGTGGGAAIMPGLCPSDLDELDDKKSWTRKRQRTTIPLGEGGGRG
ncbi:hypothetical protein [Candidatus Methanocrinis natronophilus]|uniref:hypothetical protein n=1 Tax=Candidatus Methanocrinis natronophilus TaxID=3033396 RepID=UPI002934E4BE|nr:hypothetical protein [Candidatus Methanocrinis natronophilus]